MRSKNSKEKSNDNTQKSQFTIHTISIVNQIAEIIGICNTTMHKLPSVDKEEYDLEATSNNIEKLNSSIENFSIKYDQYKTKYENADNRINEIDKQILIEKITKFIENLERIKRNLDFIRLPYEYQSNNNKNTLNKITTSISKAINILNKSSIEINNMIDSAKIDNGVSRSTINNSNFDSRFINAVERKDIYYLKSYITSEMMNDPSMKTADKLMRYIRENNVDIEEEYKKDSIETELSNNKNDWTKKDFFEQVEHLRNNFAWNKRRPIIGAIAKVVF